MSARCHSTRLRRQDGDPLAGPDAEIRQAGRDLGDRLAVIGPRQGLPPACRCGGAWPGRSGCSARCAEGLDDGGALDHDW